MTQPRLRSDRLILRPPHESDADFMVEALSDRAVWEWLSVIPQPYTRDHALAFINEISNGQNWVIEHQGAPTGVIGLAETLGYWLARRYWGQGIVTEAGHTLIRHSFSDPDRSQIASAYFIGNDRSRRALEKLGFQDAGPHRLGCLSDGRENIPARRMILTRRRWQTLTEPASCLTTARLTLRPLTQEDSPTVHAIVSHWEVAKQLASWPWPPRCCFHNIALRALYRPWLGLGHLPRRRPHRHDRRDPNRPRRPRHRLHAFSRSSGPGPDDRGRPVRHRPCLSGNRLARDRSLHLGG